MTILSIDGGKNVGYALFTDKGEEIDRGVIDFEDFFKNDYTTGLYLYGTDIGNDVEITFKEYFVDQLVVEGFRHDPSIKQGGSLHWASQIEGAVKMIGAVTETPVTVQYAGTALPVAMQITGYVKPTTKTGNKKHLPDQDSAWLHGMYWLHCNEVI